MIEAGKFQSFSKILRNQNLFKRHRISHKDRTMKHLLAVNTGILPVILLPRLGEAPFLGISLIRSPTGTLSSAGNVGLIGDFGGRRSLGRGTLDRPRKNQGRLKAFGTRNSVPGHLVQVSRPGKGSALFLFTISFNPFQSLLGLSTQSHQKPSPGKGEKGGSQHGHLPDPSRLDEEEIGEFREIRHDFSPVMMEGVKRSPLRKDGHSPHLPESLRKSLQSLGVRIGSNKTSCVGIC